MGNPYDPSPVSYRSNHIETSVTDTYISPEQRFNNSIDPIGIGEEHLRNICLVSSKKLGGPGTSSCPTVHIPFLPIPPSSTSVDLSDFKDIAISNLSQKRTSPREDGKTFPLVDQKLLT